MGRPPVHDRPTGLATRVVVGLLLLLVAWIVLRMVLGFVFSLIRMALFVALFAVIAWVVLIGTPGSRSS